MPETGRWRAAATRWVATGHGGTLGVVALGALLVLGQLAFVYSQSSGVSFRVAYRELFQFDCYWYGNIALEGYALAPPGRHRNQINVAFFPGFPLLVRALRNASGLPLEVAVVLTAQLACWGFWTYFLLLLRRWQVPARGTALAVCL